MKGKFWLAFGLLSCGEPAELTPTAPQYWCRGVCEAAERCGARESPGSCESRCLDERPGLANISVNGAAELEHCLATMSCDALYDEELWDRATDACWQRAQETVQPTAGVRRFCAGYVEAWFECGAWYSTEECEGDWGMWTDAVLSRVARCEAVACSELEDCIDQVMGSL